MSCLVSLEDIDPADVTTQFFWDEIMEGSFGLSLKFMYSITRRAFAIYTISSIKNKKVK